MLFNELAAQFQGKYTRFHYVYAGLHGLPADLVLRATSQAVLGPRLGHAGCVTSRTNCASTACCGRSGTTPRPDLAGAFPARVTTKPPEKNARHRRCGFCWAVESLRFIIAQLITGTKLYSSRIVSTKLHLRSIVLCRHDSLSSEKMHPSSA